MGRVGKVPVMFSRRRSMAHTFSAGLRREDMGLSGSRRMTGQISWGRADGIVR
jgi:hypothetical protein